MRKWKRQKRTRAFKSVLRGKVSGLESAENVEEGHGGEDEDEPGANGEKGDEEPAFHRVESYDQGETEDGEDDHDDGIAGPVEVRRDEDPDGGKEGRHDKSLEESGTKRAEIDLEESASDLHENDEEDELCKEVDETVKKPSHEQVPKRQGKGSRSQEYNKHGGEINVEKGGAGAGGVAGAGRRVIMAGNEETEGKNGGDGDRGDAGGGDGPEGGGPEGGGTGAEMLPDGVAGR